MAEPAGIAIRPLAQADLDAYKALRDAMLAAHPEAFTSDAETEARKSASHYAKRLGVADGGDPACFTLGAFEGDALVGAISCERDGRAKVRHIAHLVGMMVRPGWRRRGVGVRLLGGCIETLRSAGGIERLTLSVTSTNADAVRLYERAGFIRYGRLEHAIKLGDRYHAKDLMTLAL